MSPVLTILNGGNVGIGTTGPGAKLTILKDTTDPSTYDDGLALFASKATGGDEQSIAEFRHDNLSQGVGIGYASVFATGSNTNQDLKVFARGSGNLLLNTGSGSTGNVGIGTASPSAKLHVYNGNLVLTSSETAAPGIMLHMNGTDTSTSFPDNGSFGQTWTAGGNAQVDTAQSKFGGASALFDNNNDYIVQSGTLPDITSDYTIDVWVRPNTLATSDAIFSAAGSVTQSALLVNATGQLTYTAPGTSIVCAAALTTGS
jgi:hypothetical protein